MGKAGVVTPAEGTDGTGEALLAMAERRSEEAKMEEAGDGWMLTISGALPNARPLCLFTPEPF